VNLYPCGGYSSLTFAYEAAREINGGFHKFNNVALYIGDYDPAGMDIDRALEEELRKHLNPTVSLEFIPPGITPEQIVKYDLPTKPRTDTTSRALHITETVEAEAMPADIMLQLLREAIDVYLPEDAIEDAEAADEAEAERLDLAVKLLKQ